MTTRWCHSKYIREKKPVITTKALLSQEDVVVGKSSESRLLLVVAPPRAAAAGNHRRFCRRGLKSSLKESRLLHAPNVAPMIWYSSKQKRDATQSGVCCAFVCCIFTLSFSLQSLFFFLVCTNPKQMTQTKKKELKKIIENCRRHYSLCAFCKSAPTTPPKKTPQKSGGEDRDDKNGGIKKTIRKEKRETFFFLSLSLIVSILVGQIDTILLSRREKKRRRIQKTEDKVARNNSC